MSPADSLDLLEVGVSRGCWRVSGFLGTLLLEPFPMISSECFWMEKMKARAVGLILLQPPLLRHGSEQIHPSRSDSDMQHRFIRLSSEVAARGWSVFY